MGRVRARIHEIKSAHFPEFEIAYQPIVNVRTRQVIAYEALTRGLDGRSFPDLMLAMAPAAIRSFHRKTAYESIRRAKALGLFDTAAALCINMQPDLAENAVTGDFILDIAKREDVPPAKILLELTEDHHLTLPDLRELVARNHSAGFATGMDDFGSGYSGLTMLVECRPEVLKLDRALVRGIDQCEIRTKVVAAFADISNSLGMILVAEGVETPEECARLQEVGIDIMQGYLFSRPVVNALPMKEVWAVAQGGQDAGERRAGEWRAGEWRTGDLGWVPYWKTEREAETLTLQAECA